MKLKAYAKVNLCLKVYKGVYDSKHKIDSIMMLYKKLSDDIYIKKSSDMFVCYVEKGRPIILPDCLVQKALKYLKYKYNININYFIKIIKHIPYGGGLGGGSSDAAAVMNYVLSKHPNIQLDLREIAVELGSDIPFFLTKYSMARVKDIGNFVTPIYNWHPKLSLTFLPVFCSTTKAFVSLENDREYTSKVNVDSIIQKHLYQQPTSNVAYNDLTKYIIQNYKELQSPYQKFKHNSFFSGAGSTIVTLLKD